MNELKSVSDAIIADISNELRQIANDLSENTSQIGNEGFANDILERIRSVKQDVKLLFDLNIAFGSRLRSKR